MEHIRILNSDENMIRVVIEPWGNEYDVNRNEYLSVNLNEMPALIQMEFSESRIINLFVDGSDIDLDLTQVHLQK